MPVQNIERYGATWPIPEGEYGAELKIEMACIQRGGKWKSPKTGKACGEGLSFHYERMRNLIWPQLDCHRWHVLIRDEILKNTVTTLMGPGSSGKTHSAAWIFLCEYLCFPDETCVLISSTHIDGLRLRVWAEMTMLWQQAVDKFPFLAGNLLDSKILISTDSIDEKDFDERRVRDWRKGIKGVPCIQNGKFIGLGKFLGIKQKRVRLIGDELQFMGSSYLSSFANLANNESFKAVLCGNPNDILDPLGRAAEPVDGWANHMEPAKTTTWKTRFMDGVCVNLVGTDSPNFDFPENEPSRYKYLISKEKIANTVSFFGRDSYEYFSQCVGVMKVASMANRVITRDLCLQFGAHNNVLWKGTGTTKVYAVDAAYGGDRCVKGWAEFGMDNDGKMVLAVHKPSIVAIRPGAVSPEDQIAMAVKNDCEALSIPPQNMGHDATGRGSLGTAIARIWSAMTNPVEFGGSPTERPVSLDLYLWDSRERKKRLKRCDEHYRKFVSELWFSVRYVIEAGQMRNLPEDVMEEGCMREWRRVSGDKIEVETKEEMKERVGRSPDLFDWLSIIVEMARRKGFNISKLASHEESSADMAWLDELKRNAARLRDRYALNF